MDRASLISQLQNEHPGCLPMVIETLVDVYLKNPEWIKQEARKLQREDLKGDKYKKKQAETVRQSIFPSVIVEESEAEPGFKICDISNNE